MPREPLAEVHIVDREKALPQHVIGTHPDHNRHQGIDHDERAAQLIVSVEQRIGGAVQRGQKLLQHGLQDSALFHRVRFHILGKMACESERRVEPRRMLGRNRGHGSGFAANDIRQLARKQLVETQQRRPLLSDVLELEPHLFQ